MIGFIAAWQVVGPLYAAEVIWTADSSADFNWSNGANWDLGEPSAADDVIFPKDVLNFPPLGYPNPGALFAPDVVTLGMSETANSLSLLNKYTLSGGDLTLTSGGVRVTIGNTSTIESLLHGTAGLTKEGDGALILTNALNDYVGTTTINAGSIIITDQGALGTDTSAVVVTGNVTRGVGGGTLVVGSANNNLTGLTFARDLALTGGGASGDGTALNSVGDNTFTGNIVTGGNPAGLNPIGGIAITASGTRLASTFGTTTLNGGLTLDPSGQSTEFSGNGNWTINSNIDGAGNLVKTGNGLLVLNGDNTFGGILQVTAGFTRISSQANLGASTANNAIFLTNGGKLEFRTDSPDFTTAKRLTVNSGTTTVTMYLDRDINGSGMNQTVGLGLLTLTASTSTRTINVDGRNGYNLSFTGNMGSGNQGSLTVSNTGNGLFSNVGNFWNTTNSTVRTLTFGSNGDFLITGNVLASGASHILTKSGTGTLTLTGTGSTYAGATNIQGGTLAVSDFRAINNNGATINIGNTSTTAILNVVGNNLAGENVITDKVINLFGTTGGATILANQTGTSPGLRFNSDFTASGGSASNVKTLTLGGTNAQDNTIFGVIPDNAAGGAVNLAKIDSGTWLLAGSNLYTGTTTVSGGLLKIAANGALSTVINDASIITFASINTNAGGTLEYVGQDGVDNVEVLGALTPTAGAGTVRLSPGVLGTASLAFSSLGTINDAATVNFVGADFVNNTIQLGGVTDGLVSPRSFFGGADFAFSEATLLRAPVYGVDADFITSATALAATANNEITGSFTTTGSITIDTLKINGPQTLTLDAADTLTIRTGAANTDGAILATGGASTITGGTAVSTGGSGSLTVYVDGQADSLRMESVLTGFSGGVTKSGAGTLILAGANNQTGTFTINEGTVRLAAGGRIAANNVSVTIRQLGALDLNGVTPATYTNSWNNNGVLTNTGAAEVTFTVGGSNGTGTSYGSILQTNGVINITKRGTGNQSWFGVGDYTGVTTIGGTGIITTGLLTNIGTPSGIGSGNIAANAASLVFNGADAGQAYGALSYNGRESVSIDRLFTFGGTAADSGARILANGANDSTIVWSNSGALAFGTTDIEQGLVLGGASIGSNRFNPQITDNGTGVVSLYKTDAGLWILGNAANSFTGATTINAGALRADGTALPAGSPLVINGGVLQSSGLLTRPLSAAPITGAGTVSWTGNGGFAGSTSKLTVNLGGNIVPDTLQWGVGGFVSGTLILSSTTSFAEVEILNGIDLNGANRTIQVDVNSTTNSDLATLSGVVSNSSGTAGIVKTGSGILRLLGDNTYNGDTALQSGTIRAVAIGNSTSAASNFGTGAGSIILGNTTSTVTLAYVGSGENSNREIRVGGTTASIILESSGSGALVLTNVVNTSSGTGAKTLYLRGDLNAANEITSALGDNSSGGVLNVTKDDNGTWVLSGQSTYTGTTTVSAGALGIASDSVGAVGAVASSPVGVTRLTISNGALFALDGDRTLNTLVRLNSNASSNFIGINSITLNSIETTTGGTMTVANFLPLGKLLTLNSPTFTGTETSTARTFAFNGPGDTILNASVTDSTGGAVISLTYNGSGSLTLGGSNGGSSYTGSTTISSGTLKIGTADAVPHGTGAGNVVMNPGAGLTATLDLNGFDQTINGLTAASAGTANIDNSSANPAVFTFGATDQDVNLIGGVTNSGGGALSLVKSGSGVATFNQGPFSYTGTTTVAGGSLTIAEDVSGTTALSVAAGSFLGFTGGLSASASITSVSVGDGGELKLFNSLGEPLANLASLSLGAGSILDLNAGSTTDTLTLLGPNVASVGGAVSLNVRDTGSMLGATTYDLLVASSGGLLTGGGSAGSYALTGIPGGFTTLTLNQSDTVVSLTTGTLVSDKRYWTGAASTAWNSVNGTFDGLNWSPDKSGAAVSAFIPGSGTTVVFSADNAVGGALVTTLEQGFRINALEFESSTSTATSVAIDPGTDSTNRLIISPASNLEGITLKAGGPAVVDISAPLRIDVDQTWTVADSGSTLTLSGGLSGPGALTTGGLGTTIISAAAGGTFTSPTVFVNSGTLELGNPGALGTTVVGNAAAITVNSGAAFYYNGAGATVNNDLFLAGGTLSAGTATQTYNGTVTVNADSFINMRDSNSAVTFTSARSITLSGQLIGSGMLTVDSQDTLTAGNFETGTFTLGSDNSGWSGGLDLLRGTVTATNLAGLGTGDIAASAGRIILAMPANNTVDLPQNLTIDAAGGLLEIEVNAAGTLSGDLTVNFNGTVTLGSNTNADNALRLVQNSDNFSILRFTNSFVLGNNASISYAGSAVRPLEISAVISETGGTRSLAINDDLGGWGQTNQVVRLSGANSFSGDLTVTAGVLEFTTASDGGGAANSLGRGNAISIGAATLRFVGDAISQSTNRPITQTVASIFSANGTNGASITFTGPINADVNTFTLTGAPGSQGFIASGITTSGVTDANITGGTWNLTGTTTIGDDLFVIGTDTVLNLNSTGALTFTGASTSGTLVLRDGATVNLGADDAIVVTEFDRLYLSQDAGGDTTVLNTGTFNLSTNYLILGERAADRNGIISGTGTLTVVGGNYDLYEGTINANLASDGSLTFEKFGPGIVTLAGDNSGLAATGATIVNDGTLVLDYTADNNTKIRSASQLNMIGGNLRLLGNASLATSQSVAGFTQGSGGSNYIELVSSGQDVLLQLGAITRANLSADGTTHFVLPAGGQTAANGITTTSPNSTSGLLGNGSTSTNDSAYATVNDGTGVWFASNDGSGNIVALHSTIKNDVTTWALGDHVTDDGTGYTGTIQGVAINSLRFDAAVSSDVFIDQGGVLSISSGGILVTDNVGGSPSIIGGTLASGATEIIVSHQAAPVFEIGADIHINHAVTKTGSGTLLLTGNNVYVGYTDLQEGTLQASGGNAIGDDSLVLLAVNRDTLFELFSDETIGRLSGGRRATDSEYGIVKVGTHTLTINEINNTTYAGAFTGSGKIVLQGGFDLLTQNASTDFNGMLDVRSGMYRLNNIASINATSITVNSGGTLLIDNTGTTRSGTRLLDTAPIDLNSADGVSKTSGFGTYPTVRGFWIRSDQTATLDETVGAVTAASGANYVSLEATITNADSDIIAFDLRRTNNATLNVRGTNLGTTTGTFNQLRIGDAANQTEFIAALVGGGGAAGSTNVSIVPWAIGEDLGTAALAANNMGNSLVTYVSGAGIRPLKTTEYATFGGAAANDNVREDLAADLTGLSGKTINSFVINNAATATVNVTGAGAGQALDVSAGALLFTVTGAAANASYTTVLDGFDSGIGVGATNEYVIHVVNPNSSNNLTGGSTSLGNYNVTVANTANLQPGMLVYGAGIPVGASVLSVTDGTHFVMNLPAVYSASSQTYQYSTLESLTAVISSPLSSAADLTKSGRGTLVLSGLNTAGGGSFKTTLNEGVLEIADLANIGGDVGGLVFAGGTLRLGAGFVDDISLRTITLLDAGATIDTNGNDISLAGSVGGGLGGITKIGSGTLTLNGAANYTGATWVNAGTLAIGANDATGLGGDITVTAGATLNIGTSSLTAGFVTTNGDGTSIDGTGTINAAAGFAFKQTGDTTIDAVLAGSGGLFKNQSNVLTLGGMNTFTGPVELQGGTLSFATIGNVGAGPSALGAPTTIEDAVIRTGFGSTSVALTYTGGGSSTDRILALQGTTGNLTINADGTGALILGKVQTETTGNKDLILRGTSDAAVDNAVGLIEEYVDFVNVIKSDANTWVLTGANNYSGATTAGGGVLRAANDLAFGTTSVVTLVNSNAILELAQGITIANDLAISGTGNNKTLQLQSGAASAVYSGNVTISETTPGNFDVSAFASGTLTISGIIGGAGAAGVSKVNAGTVVLSGANTYTGDTVVNEGTLQLGDGSTFGSLTTSSAISIASGATFSVNRSDTATQGVDFSGAAIIGAGGFRQSGSGTTILNATNTYSGGTALNGGVLQVDSAGAIGTTGEISFAGGTLQYTVNNTTDYSDRFSSLAGQVYRIDTNAQTVVYDTSLTSVGGTLTKLGAGRLTLSSTTVNTYAGATVVSDGVFTVDGSLAGAVNVNGGTFNGGLSGTPAVVAGAITVDSAGEFSAGSSTTQTSVVDNNGNGVGRMDLADNLTWNAGSTLVFDFSSTTGVGIEGTNWDYLDIAGTLEIHATSTNKITLFVDSWSDLNTYGAVATFDTNTSASTFPTASYQWLWAHTGGITDGTTALDGDLVDYFAVDAVRANTGALFFDPNMLGGTFWVSASGNDLYINYASVPEPGSLLLISIAGLGLAGYRRRKRRLGDADLERKADRVHLVPCERRRRDQQGQDIG